MARSPLRGGMDRTVRKALLAGGFVLVLYPLFRLWVLPLFPQVQGWLEVVLAAGAAGAIAAWMMRRGRKR